MSKALIDEAAKWARGAKGCGYAIVLADEVFRLTADLARVTGALKQLLTNSSVNEHQRMIIVDALPPSPAKETKLDLRCSHDMWCDCPDDPPAVEKPCLDLSGNVDMNCPRCKNRWTSRVPHPFVYDSLACPKCGFLRSRVSMLAPAVEKLCGYCGGEGVKVDPRDGDPKPCTLCAVAPVESLTDDEGRTTWRPGFTRGPDGRCDGNHAAPPCADKECWCASGEGGAR